jgi:hypothetical protein
MTALIINRKMPPVTGIDLEHALNYVSEQGLTIDWFYTSYTNPKVFYRKGSRKKLEAASASVVSSDMDNYEKIRLSFKRILSRGF